MTITKQQLFDKVATHLLTQKCRSMGTYPEGASIANTNLTSGCLYRGTDNTQCAFGCLIPDELYQPSMEGRLGGSILNDTKHSQLAELYPVELHHIIRELQHLHDWCDIELWPTELGLMAVREGLNLNMEFEFKS